MIRGSNVGRVLAIAVMVIQAGACVGYALADLHRAVYNGAADPFAD
jgi:hypothetical protein